MPLILDTLGPNAPQTAFLTMDPQGPRNGRDTSRVLNNAMAGKLNCINEVEGALADITPGDTGIRIYDTRISPQSVVVTQALSDAAAFLDFNDQGQGWIEFVGNNALLDSVSASGSMLEPGEAYIIGAGPPGQEIDFNSIGNLPLRLMTFSDANNNLTLHMAGVYQASVGFLAEGLANNRTYFLDIVFTHAQHGVYRTTFEYNSRTNGFIDDFKMGFADVDEDTVVTAEIYGDLDTITIECGIELLRVQNSQLYANRVPEEIFAGDPYFRVRYAVIG